MSTKNGTPEINSPHVCPWWLAYTFDNFLRRLLDPPEKSLKDVVVEGMTVLDIGCGFGHYSIGAARMVGPQGKVIAADLQKKMLQKTMARARRLRLADRLTTWQCHSNRIGYSGRVDAAIAGNVVHEMPNAESFFEEVLKLLHPAGLLLITEPAQHVTARIFENEIKCAHTVGFECLKQSKSFLQHRALFRRSMMVADQ